MKVVCVSGFFNPLHIGHIRMFNEARKMGDRLIVIVNSDLQVGIKGSKLFMNEDDRAEIISNLESVDKAVISIDTDGSVCKTLEWLSPKIFANGGDRKADNIPEDKICEDLGIKMIFGVGGDKIRNSSDFK